MLVKIWAFLLTVCYMPEISGAATSTRWIFLAVSLPIALGYYSFFMQQHR